MKKVFLSLAVIAALTVVSCKDKATEAPVDETPVVETPVEAPVDSMAVPAPEAATPVAE